MVKKRQTFQKEMLEKELGKIDAFFTAEELFERIRKKHTNIGIATIYRFLKEAVNNGGLYWYDCDRKKIYSKDTKSHCHFVCEKTGKIIHFKIDSLDFLRNKIPGSIRSYQVEVRGVCRDHCKACFSKRR